MYWEMPSMKKKVWKFSNFSIADPRMASSHGLRPDLDAPGGCLFSDDLIRIVLRQSTTLDKVGVTKSVHQLL